jgi:hypothetical protein
MGGVIPPDTQVTLGSHPVVTIMYGQKSYRPEFEMLRSLDNVSISKLQANTQVPFSSTEALADDGKSCHQRICYQA